MNFISEENVSFSRISCYLGCGYKYNFIYNMGMVPRVDNPAPTLGSAGHAGMAAGILGNSVGQALEEWKDKFIKKHPLFGMEIDDEDYKQSIAEALAVLADDIVDKASIIVPRALDYLHLEDWETVIYRGKPLVEAKFVVPMVGFKGYTFVTDWVAKYKPTNMTWLIDHKFRKQLQSDEVEEFGLQLPSYQYCLGNLGIKTVGSMSNQVLAKLPTQPSRNKDGSMSRAKIATTWEVYKKALLDNGLDPSDYLEMKDKFTTEFFRSTYTFRNERQLAETWNNIIEPAISNMAYKPVYIRNLGTLSCRNCWLGDYCMEELRGGDLEYLLKNNYMPRNTDHHDDLVFNEEEEGEE